MLPLESLTLSQNSRELYEHFVPESHPLRKMDEAIDFSFILPLVAHKYHRWIGRRAKHPERMWRLLFAQYYLNLSDEKIMLAAHESLALRLFLRLDKDEKPPHPTTLGKFRFDRLDVDLYLKIHFALLEQAEEKGLLDKEERQIYDTSHVRSNTRVVSIAYLLLHARQKVIKEVKKIDEDYGKELEGRDKADRATYREEREKRRAEGLPKLTKDEKIARVVEVVSTTLAEVRARVESGQMEATERLNVWLAVLEKVIKDRDKDSKDRIVSVHDLEARKGKKGIGPRDGRKLAVNVQEDSRFITTADMVPANRNDNEMVEPLLDQQKNGIEMILKELTADKGADTGVLREGLRTRKILGNIPFTSPTNAWGNDFYKVEDFKHNLDEHTLSCPAGGTTKFGKYVKNQTQEGFVFLFRRRWCRECELRAKCRGTISDRHGRQVYISVRWSAVEQAKEHNKTEEFRNAYGKRNRVEPKIWELVYHGARRCRYRGNVRSEIQLLVTVVVVNTKRLVRLLVDGHAPAPQTSEPCPLKAA